MPKRRQTMTRTQVTKNGGVVLTAGNKTMEESLVVLYNAVWTDKPRPVFFCETVVRDERDCVSAEVPKEVTILSWRVDGAPPFALEVEFATKAIVIRPEYEKILRAVFHKLSARGGNDFGYHAVEFPDQFPPFNPFVDLSVKKVEATKSPGAVITGTPGIGKSMFLFYVLALRLIAQKTTVLHYDGVHSIVFHENGVFKLTDISHVLRDLPWDAWFLVDSNKDVKEVPTQFIKACRTSPRVLLVAASPRGDRLTFSKDMDILIMWMDPFHLWELVVTSVYQFTVAKASEKCLERFFDLFGPIARDAFRYAREIHEYEVEIMQVINNAKLADIQTGVAQATAGYFDIGLSHKVLMAFPVDDGRTNFSVKIPTQKLAELVVGALMRHTEQEARRICSLFLLHTRTRPVAGRLLETLALLTLPKGGQWSMMTMRKNQPGPANTHWVVDFANLQPCVLRIGHAGNFLQILQGNPDPPVVNTFHRTNSERLKMGSKPVLKTGFYVPDAQNLPTIDAYAYDEAKRKMTLFQITCADKHGLSPVGFAWMGVDSADLVVVTSFDGGNDVYLPNSYSNKLDNVFRLVLFSDPTRNFF
ncbi:uncharacterized protein FOMMEDRAFT_169808 [Fomitiporia mediterranea MF3/22]|uniref:uncharacterized protein n=1 Tax=Fomitiporia mediterranea (strain MF3/22) TaxID=694068 RepID=UPI000440821F|nr:uncharacterized protein FOMMEDRAFT_169808 [Fomitiporia mediterranea MF3/22]EJD01764.1 hypothetical protein FOMMEDRAFT_169808 [Fomitiporia mediterranea MF3/22]